MKSEGVRLRSILRMIFAVPFFWLILGADWAPAASPEPWHPEAPAHLRASLPADLARDAERLAQVGDEYRVLHTAHYSLVHHVDSKTAAYRVAILEDVYAAFTSYFHERGLLRRTPAAKLAVLYTPTREVFVECVGIAGLPEAVEGVYLRGAELSVFFETLGRRKVREQTIAIGDERQRLERMRRDINASPLGGQVTLTRPGEPPRVMSRAAALATLRASLQDLDRSASSLTYERGQRSLETMTHEAAHHLSFAFGLFDSAARVPRWLTEGLATYFEPSSNGYLLPLGSPHWRRWQSIRGARKSGGRIELAELLSNDRVMADLALADLAYHEAWSLVHFLATTRRVQFDDYLRAVLVPSANGSAAARIKTFERAFGAPLSEIDREWQSHVRDLSVGDKIRS